MNRMNKWNWKVAFFLLLAVNLFIVGTLFVLLFIPKDDTPYSLQDEEGAGEPVFDLHTTKAELNGFINDYLKKKLGDSAVEYTVLLTDQVELIGELPVFDQKVQMKLTFVPEALANGDILLTQKSISIGRLNLPVTYVMNVMKKSYQFPEWVEMYPNERVIYIHLTEIGMEDIRLMANTIDLENDDFHFSIFLNK
ncbi:YpmS family protein [Fervidibacillus albus]|uniref:YpmS family protein n=1 Tax=Fervidibacillus albus TaxID=2980026 RepID=A0A9E8LWP9_9BACI|nr:YpmS family protein [Fervidibacillus albus]WAA11065.1 YpmS family protein [Fervidibacillus albus]